MSIPPTAHSAALLLVGIVALCLSGSPPPRLVRLEDQGSPSLSPLYRGNSATITVVGRNFRNNNPTVSISGSGLTFNPNVTVVTNQGVGLDSFDLPITVAPDATTGLRE